MKMGQNILEFLGYIVDIPTGAIEMIDASIVEDKLDAYDFEFVELFE